MHAVELVRSIVNRSMLIKEYISYLINHIFTKYNVKKVIELHERAMLINRFYFLEKQIYTFSIFNDTKQGSATHNKKWQGCKPKKLQQ